MDMDRAYSNGAFIAAAESYPPRWAAQAAAFRASCGARAQLALVYGPGARQRFDLFAPVGAARGCLVFVHGGYWMALGRQDWSHLAAGALARGWACALPSYSLAPKARISAITTEIGAAVTAAAALVPGPVVVSGHSAGGHLSARMGCADAPLPAAVMARVRRVVPISPLSELEPLLHTRMNQTLHLDAAEVAAESPARLVQRGGCDCHVWVGAQERPSFLWQARSLAEAWNCPWTVAPGHHHFTVIDDLINPASALIATLLDGF